MLIQGSHCLFITIRSKNKYLEHFGPHGFKIIVFFLVSLQAILFYTPRWLWKSWEGGKIHALMMDLDIGLGTETEKNHKKKILIQYLWENLRFLLVTQLKSETIFH